MEYLLMEGEKLRRAQEVMDGLMYSEDIEGLGEEKLYDFYNDENQPIDQDKLKEFLENLQKSVSTGSPHGLHVHWLVYLLAFSVIFGIMGLFSYKLVYSLKEKERKKAEKKRLKELKKKK